MGSLYVCWVWAPSGCFEPRCIQKCIIDRDQSLAYSILDMVEVFCAQLVRYQAGLVLVSTKVYLGALFGLPTLAAG
jgi:hypothetical protein